MLVVIIDGINHINDKGSVLSSSSLLYADMGNLTEAEQMIQRALRTCEKELGLDHISTLCTVHNFGNLYVKLGRLDEAEEMYQRTLQGFEKALGLEAVKIYPPALDTIKNLCSLYKRLGDINRAEDAYSRALSGVDNVSDGIVSETPALLRL
jgi:tetratricopeptide (TPR) repeat protein